MATVWRLLMDEPALPWVSANRRIAIGWGEVGDIRQLGTFDAIAEAIRERNADHPDHAGKPEANVQHGAHSLHDFCFAMRPGDLVIVSDRSRRRGVWEVLGEYEYVGSAAVPAGTNYQHQRLARQTDQDADELWSQAGGGLASRINYRTLDRCANEVE
jgi:predicted Mrr-cat superfamily restriction endonuclease